MKFTDKYLTCQECGKSFCFSAKDQMSYDDKKIESTPARCLTCRKEYQKKVSLHRKGVKETICKKCGATFFSTLHVEGSFCESCLSQLSLLV